VTELIWEGKYRDGKRVAPVRIALPFQTVETVNESARDRVRTLDLFASGKPSEWRNRLIWGDKKYVLPSLLPEFAGKVNLVYIDPPFDTGADFSFTTEIPDSEESIVKQPSMIEQKAYRDTWGRGLDSYLQWFYETATLLRDLLADDGSAFIHLDATVVHYVKCICDEVFPAGFRSEVIWFHNVIGTGARVFPKTHETILWFTKSANWYVDSTSEHVRVPYSDRITKTLQKDEKGWYYVRGNRDSSGNVTGKWFRTYVDLDEVQKGKFAADVWEDIKSYRAQGDQATGYPTQKPEKLLSRIVDAFSRRDGLVLDCFCGSGTTAAVAEKLGRRWITCDLGRFAIHTTRKRLLGIEGVKPFVVQNLGKYERQAWIAAEFEKPEDRAATEVAYRQFILDLYRAEPLSGHAWIHGLKANRFVHVGAVDAPVTLADVKAIARDVWRAAGKSKEVAGQTAAVDVLGWEFAFELNEMARQTAAEARVDVRFRSIPRDVLDKRAIEQGDVQAKDFFELRAFSTKISVKKRVARVELVDFMMPAEDLPEEVRKAVKYWAQWVDYWAIDWDFKHDTFHNEWQSYRARGSDAKLELEAQHEYKEPGTYAGVVKVIDLLGCDTTKMMSLEVR